jgi:NAD(P)-dependent dehydrogenase (short-subunit alcohol dehydrogenase family)
MRILVVGATGDIGGAVADALAVRHQVLRASRKAPDEALRVDIGDPASIRALYSRVGKLGAVVSCAGDARPGALTALTDEDFAHSIGNKLMGQVNLVRFGIDHVQDNGVFLLTAGIYGTRPPPRVPAMAMVNGALESFARAASKDLPRGIRLNTISSPFLQETAARLGMKGSITAADNAQHYVRLVEGTETGQVVYP